MRGLVEDFWEATVEAWRAPWTLVTYLALVAVASAILGLPVLVVVEFLTD